MTRRILMAVAAAVAAGVITLAPCVRAEVAASTPTRESNATLVVYNNADPSSIALAAYYAKRRAIPLEHLVGLNCPTNEEITRDQYDTTIADPLRKIFAKRGWWHEPANPQQPVTENQIRFVALMRGIPLKIMPVAKYPGDSFTETQQVLNTNGAAVDSELATLGVRTRRISGAFRNPYYDRFTPFMDLPLPSIMLVCRLDGPTVEVVENMIDGAILAERQGLRGFAYIDLRGITSGPMVEGDQWLATAAVGLRHYGFPLVWENTENLFPPDYPMDHAAIYLGWYSASVAGPMARDDFRFEPGAIAVHIHSFSATTLRDPHAAWAAPLLTHGAAATLGNVYEPYLDFTPHLDIFADHLRNGFNFAESAYASQIGLSWMTTFVGDPLYRPLPDEINDPMEGVMTKPSVEYEALRKGARAWYEKGHAAGEAELKASAAQLHSGLIWEGLGLLDWSIPANDAALAAFQQAQQCYGVSDDGLRTVLHQVQILTAEDKRAPARALAAKALPQYSAFRGSSLLRSIIGQPPPPSR